MSDPFTASTALRASSSAAETPAAGKGGCAEPDPAQASREAQLRQQMDAVIDSIAAELYNLASLLVGEGEECVGLVETAIDKAEISACQNPKAARKSIGRALCKAGVALLASRDAESLAAPEPGLYPANCMEDDDPELAGISLEQLEQMIAGPERGRVRAWLGQLPVAVRTVFVIRAIAGMSTADTASILTGFGGVRAAGWKPESVRETFRQGLCSLTSQLLHATASGG